MIIYGTTSDDKVVNLMIFCLQCFDDNIHVEDTLATWSIHHDQYGPNVGSRQAATEIVYHGVTNTGLN